MGGSWEGNCRRIVLALFANRGWQLGDKDAVAETVCRDLASSNATQLAIERLAIRHYCIILHAACGDKDRTKQTRALTELWTYLYSMAEFKTHHDVELAKDLAQAALVKTWTNLGKCKDHGSFLNFAALILINETRDHFRKAYKRQAKDGEESWIKIELTESELPNSDSGGKLVSMSAQVDDSKDIDLGDQFDEKTKKEFLATVEQCIKNLKHRAVLLEMLKSKGYKEIAERLEMTIGNVYVCMNRGIEALRKCEAFLQFLEERVS